MKNKILLQIISFLFLLSSCSKDSGNTGSNTETNSLLPTITTKSVTTITATTAIGGGTVTNNGGYSILSKGVVWSTSSNPTVSLSTKTNNGTGSGTFISNIIGLNPNTLYYIRAYATTSAGTFYGNKLTFYTTSSTGGTGGTGDTTVTIGTQVLMNKNLNVATYRNGDLIPQVTDSAQWSNLTTGAWCYYNNDPILGAIYGKLYNWYAINDPRGLAPIGWHIPSATEWETLNTFLGGYGVSGGKLKEAGTVHWQSPNTGAANSSKFTALPGGARHSIGSFQLKGYIGYWWSSTQFSGSLSWYRYLYYSYNYQPVGNYAWGPAGNPKGYGFSVRCIKD